MKIAKTTLKLVIAVVFISSCQTSRPDNQFVPTPLVRFADKFSFAFQGEWTLHSTDDQSLPNEYKSMVLSLVEAPSECSLFVIDSEELRKVGMLSTISFDGKWLYASFAGETIPGTISFRLRSIDGVPTGLFTHGLSGTDAYRGNITLIPYKP